MTAQEHILSELKKLRQPTSLEDIAHTPQEEAIFAKVMSKKFRKLKADEVTTSRARQAINFAVAHSQPVTVSFLFGGNKLWRFEEAPEIDWAELFALIYFLNWMKSIASVYPPGVTLDFFSEDVAVETLNNITRAEADEYSRTFRAMLEWLKPYMPERVNIRYRRYGEQYKEYADYLSELEAAKQRHLEANHGELPTLSEKQKQATELNVRLLPGQTDDPLWREKVELTHRSLEETDTITKVYFDDLSLVMACPTSYSGWIAVGSTKRSYAKFWAGVGVLERSVDGFNELVLTPKQLELSQYRWQDVHIEGLAGKNFSRIRILE